MSGPIYRPLAVEESDGSVIVRPCSTLAFNAADFSVAASGNEATISIDSTGTGAALTATYVGYGDGSNLLTGASTFTYDGSEVTIKRADTGICLTLESTDDGASGAPDMRFFRNSATPTVGDDIGIILFAGEDSGGNIITYSEISSEIDSPTDTDEAGRMRFRVRTDGAMHSFIRMLGNESGGQAAIRFNEGSHDIDFVWESDSLTTGVKFDAGNSNVGIGGSPSSDVERLHVQGTGTADPTVMIESTSTDLANEGPQLELYRSANLEDGDRIGLIRFSGQDDAGNKTEYGRIEMMIADETTPGEDGEMIFYLTEAGSIEQEYFRLRGASRQVEFNTGLDDIDFVINSDAVTNFFFLNANQDNLGIGGSPDSDVERLHVKGAGVGDDIVRIQTDDDGSASGPHIQIYRNSATPQDGDDMGEIFFAGNHAATSGGASAGKENYARIRAEAPDVESSAECGRLMFDVATNGSMIEFARMTSSGSSGYIVFNESSNNIDFRVESNSNGNMFKVDAGLDIVSVGATAVSGGADFQVPSGTMSSYCRVEAVRSDATAQQNMDNDDCQGQTWVNNSATDWTIQLPEGGLKGQWFHLVSTGGNWTIDPQGTDTLNGGTASLARNTDYAIYTVICITNGVWIVNNNN